MPLPWAHLMELGKLLGEGNGNPLQYSCLENPTVRKSWQAIVHGVARVGHDLATMPPPPGTAWKSAVGTAGHGEGNLTGRLLGNWPVRLLLCGATTGCLDDQGSVILWLLRGKDPDAGKD